MSLETIRLLRRDDAEAYRRIRLDALRQSPEAFGSVLLTEAARPLADFAARLEQSRIFAAYGDGSIEGIVGYTPEQGEKDRHKAHVSGMFVTPDKRRCGIGDALLRALIDDAIGRVEQLHLSVAQGNRALSLYRRHGFEIYGVEPRALKCDGSYLDEILPALMLPARAGRN